MVSKIDYTAQKPSWRSWLARQSHNLKVVSSSLTEGILLLRYFRTQKQFSTEKYCLNFAIWFHLESKSVFEMEKSFSRVI